MGGVAITGGVVTIGGVVTMGGVVTIELPPWPGGGVINAGYGGR
jgi:hypothetical protein